MFDKDLPDWVPSDKQVRDDVVGLFNDGLKLAAIKRAGYVIKEAWVDSDGWLFLTIDRCGIIGRVKVGKFSNLKGVRVVDNVLKVDYIFEEKSDTKENMYWFGGGMGAGVLLVILLILVF